MCKSLRNVKFRQMRGLGAVIEEEGGYSAVFRFVIMNAVVDEATALFKELLKTI